MKRMGLILLGLIVASALMPLPLMGQAPLPDISGTWKLAADIGGTGYESVCTLKQDAGKLTGTCKSDVASAMELNGTVTPDGIRWAGKVQYNGQELTVTYKAKLTGAMTLTGTVDVQPMDVQGTFGATRDTREATPSSSSSL